MNSKIRKTSLTSIIIIFLFFYLNSCGIYKYSDARKVPVNAADKRQKNLDEGRGFRAAKVLGKRGGGQFDFSGDGAEIFPANILSDWATDAINGETKYYVRVSTASVTTAPTIKRIQMRPYAAYCTTQDVYELMQLKNVLSGTDFTSSTVPSKSTVEQYIMEAQSYIDMQTRKSWRPNIVVNELIKHGQNARIIGEVVPSTDEKSSVVIDNLMRLFE